jgi:hypothetical protein
MASYSDEEIRYLYSVTHSRGAKRIQLLRDSSPKQLSALTKMVRDTLVGNFPLTSNERKRLEDFKKQIRQFACPKGCVTKKRKAIVQRGGFLQFLLPMLAPVVGSLLSSVVGGNRE